MDFPRDNLTRSVPFEAIPSDDGLTFEGYAAVFGQRTEIDSWEGHFTEEFLPGAFTRTINAKTPVMQFDHGKHPFIGSIPLGTIKELREDAQGLYVKARLHPNWMIEPVRDAIREGSIDGMSLRMAVIQDDWTKGTIPHRAIREARVPELGPVVFPAYAGTTASVRSRELAALLADPELRSQLAQALILGTPPVEPAPEGTSPEGLAARQDPPPVGHSGMSRQERDRVLTLIAQGVQP